jgi:hypothetical protein
MGTNALKQLQQNDCFKMIYAMRILCAHPKSNTIDKPAGWWGDSASHREITVTKDVEVSEQVRSSVEMCLEWLVIVEMS